MSFKKAFLFGMVLFLSGCASFYANRYPNDTFAPTNSGAIAVFNNFPPEPYDVIGELGGDGAPASSWSGIGKRLRELAAQMGGDAVVILEQDTPYVGTISTPTTVTTTSTAYGSASGSAYVSGNNIYGQASGHSYGQSYTTINPGTSTQMFGKSVRAVVIKYKDPSKQLQSQIMVNDEKYGIIPENSRIYVNQNPQSTKTAKLDLAKAFDNYVKTKDFDSILAEKNASYQKERNEMLQRNEQNLIAEFDRKKKTELTQERDARVKEVLVDIKNVVAKFAQDNGFRVVYSSKMKSCRETSDVTDSIVSLLNASYKK